MTRPAKFAECEECKRMFLRSEPEQRFCGRHCARVNQARHGVASHEDKKARVLDAVGKAIDAEFREHKG